MQTKKWIMREAKYSNDEVLSLSKALGIPPIVVIILLRRGVADIERFIHTETDRLHDPFLMKGVRAASERIIAAIENKEKITVYGDYDVDGITATVVMVKFLKSHGAKVSYYIPDRLEEGYGINKGAIDSIAEDGTNLLITVDCGITAVEEVEYAKQCGLDVLVTDHHECKDELPKDCYIVNPKQPDCSYPFKKLAGVGVVFKLIQAITIMLRFHITELLDEYIDLVAIGTVADVMPAEDENRIIIKNGLDHIEYTSNYGIKALLKNAAVGERKITASTIGFAIAPRINAAGRMADPACAAELLLASDEYTAEKMADILENENKNRQMTENNIFAEAMNILENDEQMQKDLVLVIDHDDWHRGIVGIVASKILEKFNKPCILISTDKEGNGKGSGRSIKNFNLFEALSMCSEHLQKFGGHELAAGLSVKKENINDFRKAINDYAAKVLTDEDFVPVINIDMELPIEYININTAERMNVMQPYGMGNPAPVFYTPGLKIAGLKTIGDGRHLRMVLTKDDMYVDAIGFGMGERAGMLKLGDKLDVVYNLDLNIFRNEKKAQLHLRDIRFCKGY